MEGSMHSDEEERFFLGILSASFVVIQPLWASLHIYKMGIIAFFFFCRNKEVLYERIHHVVISHKRVTIIGLSIIFIFKYFTLILPWFVCQWCGSCQIHQPGNEVNTAKYIILALYWPVTVTLHCFGHPGVFHKRKGDFFLFWFHWDSP